ncbi:hypothetical protein [Viridibacillus arvi]|uniref:hypothetical protein n=1 Tax=Viridibacillus arvi TaxID=263475 RepID=UPI003D088EA9
MYFEDENRLQNHDDFKDLSVTLTELDDSAIFVIVKNEDVYHIVESCDEHHSLKLTKELCENLSEVFKRISKSIE